MQSRAASSNITMTDNPAAAGVSLQFLGAAGTVTGSKHLVSFEGKRVLLDCGLFQGLKDLRLRNWQMFPVSPSSIDAVILSHAHIDHSGYLPLLARQGFKGPVYCTSATADLLRVLLLDTAEIQEEDAERANRYSYTKHKPALPLYDVKDVERALRLVVTRRYEEGFAVVNNIRAVLRSAGHILGSATIDLRLGEPDPFHIVFTGDLGRHSQPIIRDPEYVPQADVLLLESTYGDKAHAADPKAELVRIIKETVERRAVLLMPAFAVGRTQSLIWILNELEEQGRIPKIPIYIDSPMATEVNQIYARHTEEHDDELRALARKSESPFLRHCCHLVTSVQESKALNRLDGPMIIISSSGMMTGGRILHHMSLRLASTKTTVLLVGYQSEGTRGRALQEGAKEIKILGEMIPVNARIETLDGLSAHADKDEILEWLSGFQKPPRQTFLVHGEARQMQGLAELIQTRLGWPVRPAKDAETVSF